MNRGRCGGGSRHAGAREHVSRGLSGCAAGSGVIERPSSSGKDADSQGRHTHGYQGARSLSKSCRTEACRQGFLPYNLGPTLKRVCKRSTQGCLGGRGAIVRSLGTSSNSTNLADEVKDYLAVTPASRRIREWSFFFFTRLECCVRGLPGVKMGAGEL